jgi:hypothetical protein
MNINIRLLLTLCLMLLTVIMPPMAFACASVCAVTVEQKTDTNHQSMMDMSSCEHEATMSATQIDQSHTEKATPCLASAMCHLTVGIYSSLLPINFLTTYPVILAHIPAFIPQFTLQLPEKPPRV